MAKNTKTHTLLDAYNVYITKTRQAFINRCKQHIQYEHETGPVACPETGPVACSTFGLLTFSLRRPGRQAQNGKLMNNHWSCWITTRPTAASQKREDSLIGSKTTELLQVHIWESPPTGRKLMMKGRALRPQPPNTCRSNWPLDAPPVR